MSCRLHGHWLRVLSLLICPLLLMQTALSAQFVGGATILVLEGNGAQYTLSEQAPKPISVRVVDRTGRPLAGASVLFAAPAGGAGGEFVTAANPVTVITDAQGIAVAPPFRANAIAGEFDIQIVATYMGQVTRLLLPQINGAKKKSSRKMIIIGAVVGGAAAAAFAAKGGGGSPAAAPPPVGATTTPTITFLNTSVGAPQ